MPSALGGSGHFIRCMVCYPRFTQSSIITGIAATMEGHGKKSSSSQPKYRIPKKKSSQSDDAHVQSPLSRLSHPWDRTLQEWTSRSKNNNFNAKWGRKRPFEKRYIDDEGPAFGQPKVILTNVLKTEIGRKYIKTQLITDITHGVQLQSDQQTSPSVDSVEIREILSLLQQNLFISRRQPKVTLTDVLRTKTGRKYIQRHLLTDPSLSDANKLQSDEQTSSTIASLESCQKISSQESRILPKRHGTPQRRPNDQKPYKDAETHSTFLPLKRCDVILEDCNIKNKERDWPEKTRKDSKNFFPGLREATFQNNESRKRRSDVFSNQWNIYSSPKSPLPSKEQRTEPIQSPGCRSSGENCQSHTHSPQQENIPQPLETDCSEAFASSNENTAAHCPGGKWSYSSPKRKHPSVTSKDEQVSPLLSSAQKKKTNTTLPPKEPLNRSERNKKSADSAEPIVLSSDEEEGHAETEDPERDLQTGKSLKLEKKETEQEAVLPLSEGQLSQVAAEGETEQVSAEPLKPCSSADHSTFGDQMGLALDINFEIIYIGKYKGKATGCARFTVSYIQIPFEVAHKKIELSVDSVHLRKFGLWMNKDSSTSRNCNTFFLWLSSDYVEQIEKQIGTLILNKQAKSVEFIFIKLPQLLTEDDQVILKKIIVEVSKKNASPDLCDYLLWEDAVEFLKEIPREENAFLDQCYEASQQHLQKDSTSVLMEPPPRESKPSLNKPSYMLLQKPNNGHYSFSITSVQKNEWKELRATGPVRNLIVYPPPPAKGGLGVTREDLECLEYGEFLNDVIIDFYLKYLLLEKAPKELAERSHIFSSFFYKCLTRTEASTEENPNLSIAQRRHGRVKRWTRHVNIFSKDYIFVPVNEESHWYIAVICFPWLEEVVYEDCPDQGSPQSSAQQSPRQPEIKHGTIRTESVLVFNDTRSDKEQQDLNSNLQPKDNVQQATVSPGLDHKALKSSSSTSKMKKICKRPCILILDSLKASSVQNTVQVLREYLEAECEAKRTFRVFDKSTMVDFCPRVPKQHNNSDCGVYLLQYVETFFQNPIVNFELPMHLERWFPRQMVRSKREEIRDLVLQLHLQQQSGTKS
ncbi:sentrin-specific protease 7 isoform X1 [Podarcis lilfordi]|uniref:Sentrin-specific protease 7 isoform X1 n=1 Tax=Podarcis lilfordi TaxID=74358 RepID=A0AA35P2B3_9SAUR|nr:sentrin-specific protease 7 isoform X1 [Podarcis lilfordi]